MPCRALCVRPYVVRTDAWGVSSLPRVLAPAASCLSPSFPSLSSPFSSVFFSRAMRATRRRRPSTAARRRLQGAPTQPADRPRRTRWRNEGWAPLARLSTSATRASSSTIFASTPTTMRTIAWKTTSAGRATSSAPFPAISATFARGPSKRVPTTCCMRRQNRPQRTRSCTDCAGISTPPCPTMPAPSPGVAAAARLFSSKTPMKSTKSRPRRIATLGPEKAASGSVYTVSGASARRDGDFDVLEAVEGA